MSSSSEESIQGDDPSEEKFSVPELKSLTYEEQEKLKRKLGVKVFNEAFYGAISKRKHSESKRSNKNRPREVSSKIKPKAKLPKPKVVPRDPRFDSLCGTYNEKIFRKSYKFVEDIKKKEIEQLEEQLKDEEDPNEINKIKYLIQRMKNQEREELKKQKKEEEKIKAKEELALENSSSKPRYKNKREQKVENLINKFSTLKKSGKLQKNILKQRKKLKSKERSNLADKNVRYFNYNEEV